MLGDRYQPRTGRIVTARGIDCTASYLKLSWRRCNEESVSLACISHVYHTLSVGNGAHSDSTLVQQNNFIFTGQYSCSVAMINIAYCIMSFSLSLDSAIIRAFDSIFELQDDIITGYIVYLEAAIVQCSLQQAGRQSALPNPNAPDCKC